MMSKPISILAIAISFTVALQLLVAQTPAPAGAQAPQGGRGGAPGGRGGAAGTQAPGARGGGAAPDGASAAAMAARRGEGPKSDPWPGQKKLLFVADVQADYEHDAINHTMA